MKISGFDNNIRKHIDYDERLLWSGKPRQGLIFMPRDAGIFLFSLVFVLIPTIVLYIFFQKAGPINLDFDNPINLVLKNFELLFVCSICSILILAGFYTAIGRFFSDSYSRKHLIYGITNKRAIIVRDEKRPTVISYEIDTLNDLQLVEYGNDYGTIRLSSGVDAEYGFPTKSDDSGSINLDTDYNSIFFQIENAREVMRILREQRQRLE